MQDDIAQSVVKELRTTLLGEEADSDASGKVKAEVSRAAMGRGTDPEAHRLYLLARYFLDRDTLEDIAEGDRVSEGGAGARSGVRARLVAAGRGVHERSGSGWVPVAEGYERAREAVERALALQPDLAEAHAHIGWIQRTYDWDWRSSQASYARALKLDPGNAIALRRAATLEWSVGRTEEAIELSRRAAEQDPLSAHAYSNLGQVLEDVDRLEESEAALRRSLELVPQRSGTACSSRADPGP